MNSDYYVAIIVFLVVSVLVMVGNFLADAVYVLADPRMRKQG
jgi:ABC-type dipeptide/oligopeptide/nickel transport system permease component